MQEFTIIFLATWKFAAIFPVAIVAMKMSFAETMLCTNIGGILGVLIFTFFSKYLLHIWNIYYPEKWKLLKKKRKLFNKRNRRIVNIKVKYGLTGIVLLNPILLSIPVSSFLVTKYYGNKIANLVYLVAGQIVWSFIYCFFYFQLTVGFH